jgi:hypothetical protein
MAPQTRAALPLVLLPLVLSFNAGYPALFFTRFGFWCFVLPPIVGSFGDHPIARTAEGRLLITHCRIQRSNRAQRCLLDVA